MVCPEPSCKMPVPRTLLHGVLSASSWDKLQDIEDDAAVASDPALLYCQNPVCGRVLRVTSDSTTVFCECGHAWCVLCKGDAHWPARCEERRWYDTNYGQHTGQQFVTPDIKCCPQCFVTIEKNGGCSHMRCRMCQYDFCWTCGSFGKGNYHEAGKPCVKSDWHLLLAYITPDIVTQALQHVITFGAMAHQIKDRVENFHTSRPHMLEYGYDTQLTSSAMLHAECAMLSASYFLTNTWLMLSSRKIRKIEFEGKLVHLASHVQNLGRLIRPAADGQVVPSPLGRTHLNRNVHSMAYALIPLIQQLRSDLVILNGQDATT